MPVHVVVYKDIIRYDGNTPLFRGRELLNEYYDTAGYKRLLPGDVIGPYNHQPEVTYEVVAADPFKANLVLSNDHAFGGPYATLYNAENDTYYPMFLGDFIHMAANTVIDHGSVTGRFGYVKKNASFGIVYLGETENV